MIYKATIEEKRELKYYFNILANERESISRRFWAKKMFDDLYDEIVRRHISN